jgi:hypothetical protein
MTLVRQQLNTSTIQFYQDLWNDFADELGLLSGIERQSGVIYSSDVLITHLIYTRGTTRCVKCGGK